MLLCVFPALFLDAYCWQPACIQLALRRVGGASEASGVGCSERAKRVESVKLAFNTLSAWLRFAINLFSNLLLACLRFAVSFFAVCG